jgi:hypothetical protein
MNFLEIDYIELSRNHFNLVIYKILVEHVVESFPSEHLTKYK